MEIPLLLPIITYGAFMIVALFKPFKHSNVLLIGSDPICCGKHGNESFSFSKAYANFLSCNRWNES